MSGDAPEQCARCGAVADGPTLAWSRSTGPRGPEWLCEACTREHVRAIEARLDDAWW